MISVIRYEGAGTGQRESRIVYEIAKGLVAERLRKAISDGDDDVTANDLIRLDGGTLPEARLLKLFTPEELKRVLDRRIGALATERDAIERLMDRLNGKPSGVEGGTHRAQIGPSQEMLFGH